MPAARENTRYEASDEPGSDEPVSVENLGTEITALCSYIYAATYRLLVLIREFDEAQGWAGPGLCSCAHWLNFKCGIGINAAREKVRVAHALKNLPKISKRFEKGELSYSKVRAMTRIADSENEDFLLRIAKHGTAYHMEKLVQKYRRAKRLQDVDHANQQYRHRYLDYHYDEDGCLVLSARLPAEQGALIVKALDKAIDAGVSADPSAPNSDKECHVEGAPHVSAEISDTGGGDMAIDHPSGDIRVPIAARRADALADIAEICLNSDGSAASTADRYQVVLHVSAETPLPGCDRECHIENGPYVSAETSRRVQCDCSSIKVTEDEDGEPLSIGRKSRTIPPAIRRALRYRDNGCRFPGCTHSRFVDGHHIRHWANGGETRLDNLLQLCRFHHRLVHEGGYGCERTLDGSIVFTAPNGQPLPYCIETYGIDDIPSEGFDDYLAEQDIDDQSCVPEFYAGDRMDWDLAVGALFASPGR